MSFGTRRDKVGEQGATERKYEKRERERRSPERWGEVKTRGIMVRMERAKAAKSVRTEGEGRKHGRGRREKVSEKERKKRENFRGGWREERMGRDRERKSERGGSER